MRNETYKCGGQYTVEVAVPTTVQEYDALAKKEGQCVIDAVDHVAYHSVLGDVRDKVVALIEEEYKVKRKEIGTGQMEEDGKTEKTKDEPFDIFLNRVAAEKGLTGEKPLAGIFKAVSVGGKAEVKFDPSSSPRQPGKPPKLPTRFADIATKLITGNLIPKFAKRYEQVLGKKLVYDTTLKDDALKVAIGWLAREMKLVEERKEDVEAFTGKIP